MKIIAEFKTRRLKIEYRSKDEVKKNLVMFDNNTQKIRNLSFN